LTTSSQWTGPVVGIVRVERELARRAHTHLGNDLEFCLYDSSRNLILTISQNTADDIVSGRLQIDYKAPPPPPKPTLAAQALRPVNALRRRMRRAVLSNAKAYHGFQRLRGRAFSREDILRIQAEEFAAPEAPPAATKRTKFISDAAIGLAKLDSHTCILSGGLDWQYKNPRNLWELKQTCHFRYCAIIYDVIPITFPHLMPSGYSTFLAEYFGELVWVADHTMCISDATRRDWLGFCKTLGIQNIPADVFSLGSDLPAHEEPSKTGLPDQLEGKRFALFVSTIEPRKNHRLLYEAWDRCIRSQMVDPERDRLVFVGRRGWQIDDLVREISTNPATLDTILILNEASDDLLHLLYQRCAFVLFPSIYEGFGLPVAEALSYGKPCITSDAGSLTEIGGDLVLRLNPKDMMRWIETIAHYMNAPAELEAWSKRIVSEYRPVTWDDAAARFFGLVKEIRP
jgi:glycosyltransferase involved in cell wall biosynthesis